MASTRSRYEVFFYFLLIFENKKWRFLPIFPSFLAITRKRLLRPPFFISPVILELQNTYPWIFSDFCNTSVYANSLVASKSISLCYHQGSRRMRRLRAIAGPPCAPFGALRDPALGTPRPLRGSSDALRCREPPPTATTRVLYVKSKTWFYYKTCTMCDF